MLVRTNPRYRLQPSIHRHQNYNNNNMTDGVSSNSQPTMLQPFAKPEVEETVDEKLRKRQLRDENFLKAHLAEIRDSKAELESGSTKVSRLRFMGREGTGLYDHLDEKEKKKAEKEAKKEAKKQTKKEKEEAKDEKNEKKKFGFF